MASNTGVGIIGIGNLLASDDGIGIRAVREVSARLTDSRVRVVESERGGMDLLEHLAGLATAVIVDAALTGSRAPGEVTVFSMHSPFAPEACPSLHTIDLPGLLAFGEVMGMPLPHTVRVVTVEAQDIETFRESCTPAVEASLPEVVERILGEIRRAMPDVHLIPGRRETAVVR